VNRSVLAGIGASVALTAGCVGMFVLPLPHHVSSNDRPNGGTLAGSLATPPVSVSPSPTHSTAKPSPSHRAKRHRSKRHRRHSPPLPHVMSGSVSIGVAVKGGIVSGVRSFAQATGARIAMVEIYNRFGAPFPAVPLHQVASTGATPLLQWNPRSSPLYKIANGAYDTYLRHWATAVKRFGRQVVLSFGHEMNGTWNPWGAGHVSSSTFVDAWRRIHNVFSQAGVHNVTWSWDPSHVGDLPEPWWPGRRYVDKIGIDGYLRPGQTFAQEFAYRLANIRSFTSKPIYIAETAVAPSSDQASQIIGLFNGVQQYHLSGFVWFNIDHLDAWHLEGRTTAVLAFRNAVAQTS
jgi:glycosyl hydrolase family 26